MKSVKLVFFLIALNQHIEQIFTVCCGTKTIAFEYFNGNNSCSDFGGHTHRSYIRSQDYQVAMSANVLNKFCEATICGNGKPTDGYYCGNGPCNIFGCNCNGGCISGDHESEFKRLYHNQVQTFPYITGFFSGIQAIHIS